MILDAVLPADTDVIFSPDAFACSIGKIFPVNLDGRKGYGRGKLLKAEVAEDGMSAKLTMMVDFEN
jgi:hypothetical protein